MKIMKGKRSIWVALLVSMIFLSAFVILGTANNKEPVDYVNPFMGSGATLLPAPWGAYGWTSPDAVVPFGMVQLAPRTENIGGNSYCYQKREIEHFSINGGKGYMYVSVVNVMPVIDIITVENKNCSSHFSHDKETSSPGYYTVTLQDYNIKAEFTVTERTGFCKFTFPMSKNAHIFLFDASNIVVVDNSCIKGQGGRYYFYAEFSRPVVSYRKYREGISVHYSTSENEVILAKVGISSVSTDGARKNLEAEIPDWDFDRVRTEAEESWNKELGRIEIEGGTEEQREIFYTALYHSLGCPPRVGSDVDGKYKGCNGKIYEAKGYTYRLGDIGGWFAYHSLSQLLTLLYPELMNETMKSIVDRYKQSGPLPLICGMSGAHIAPEVLDLYMKGVTDFDVNKVYEAMSKCSMESPFSYPDVVPFLQLGYVPAELDNSVTKTLAYAYESWALAQFAKLLGKEEDYNELMKRAYYYRNVFNPSERFMMARNKDGSWTIGGYEEGDKWTYSWCVPHDVKGLINLMGGSEAFIGRLGECFKEGHYYHDNEPPRHYPYLFSYAGVPWKTQKWVREVMEKYTTGPGGYPGNEDDGLLGSWYVMAAMGLGAVCDGSPMYILGSPIFDRVTIHLPKYWGGRDFVIVAENNSERNKYIQSATLNGQPLNRPWIAHSEIVNGGTLVFEMGPQPNKEWGSDPEAAPPSMTEGTPEFGYSTLELASTEVNVNEPLTMYLTVKNIGNAVGTTEFKLYVDGEFVKSKWVLVEPGESKKAGVTIKLYELGDHQIMVGTLGPKIVTVTETAPLF